MTNMFKPTPKKDRNQMIRDIVCMVVIGCFMLMVAVLCLSYAIQLMEENTPAAIVLIVSAVCSLVINTIYIVVAIRRMRKRRIIVKRMRLWHVEHNIVRRKQKQECIVGTSNRIFQSSLVQMSTKHKNIPVVENKMDKDSSMMAVYGLGYRFFMRVKAAMFNRITPDLPTSQYVYNHDTTWSFLDETSSSELGECVSYYTPTECDTAFLINESETLL